MKQNLGIVPSQYRAAALHKSGIERLHAQALVDVGLFQQSSLDEIKRTGSYRGVAFEVISLVQLFSDGWARVSAKTAITSADVLAGSDAADRLTAAVAALAGAVARLQAHAESQEWSQRKLAARVGLSWGGWLRCRAGVVSPRAWLPRLAAAMRILGEGEGA